MFADYLAYTIHRPEKSLDAIAALEQQFHISIQPFSMEPHEYLSPTSLLQESMTSADYLHTGWCTYTLLKAAYKSNKGLLLLHDRLVCLEHPNSIRRLLHEADDLNQSGSWDMFIMCADALKVSKPITHKLDRVFQVKGAKMVYINRNCIGNFIDAFDRALASGQFLYGDGLLNRVIRDDGLYVLGASQTKAYFR